MVNLTILFCFLTSIQNCQCLLSISIYLGFFIFMNVVWGITQHIGLKEGSKDHFKSTRSVRLNPIFSFIIGKWNTIIRASYVSNGSFI